MILSMKGQAAIFLLTVGVGFCIGFIYDLFRVSRKLFTHPDFLIQLEDIVYWLVVSFGMFYVMLNKNFGEIRMFNIMGAFLGMLLYFLTLSRLFIAVSIGLATFIGKVLRALLTILLFPFKVLFHLLRFPAMLLLTLLRNIGGHVKKVLQKSKGYAKMKGRRAVRNMKIILKKR